MKEEDHLFLIDYLPEIKKEFDKYGNYIKEMTEQHFKNLKVYEIILGMIIEHQKQKEKSKNIELFWAQSECFSLRELHIYETGVKLLHAGKWRFFIVENNKLVEKTEEQMAPS